MPSRYVARLVVDKSAETCVIHCRDCPGFVELTITLEQAWRAGREHEVRAHPGANQAAAMLAGPTLDPIARQAKADRRAARMQATVERNMAMLDALDPPPESVHDVMRRLRWSNRTTLIYLREWRQRTGAVRRSPTEVTRRGMQTRMENLRKAAAEAAAAETADSAGSAA